MTAGQSSTVAEWFEPADQHGLRRAFSCFPSGVTAVCAVVDGVPVGVAASSFTSVSLDPALVSVCFAHTSSTWPLLRSVSRLGVSVLAEHQQEVAGALASKRGDRFAAVDWLATDSGAVFVNESALWLECEVDQVVPVGDHDLAVLRIHALQGEPAVAPLVFHASGFGRLARDR